MKTLRLLRGWLCFHAVMALPVTLNSPVYCWLLGWAGWYANLNQPGWATAHLSQYEDAASTGNEHLLPTQEQIDNGPHAGLGTIPSDYTPGVRAPCITCAANHYCPEHNPAPAGVSMEGQPMGDPHPCDMTDDDLHRHLGVGEPWSQHCPACPDPDGCAADRRCNELNGDPVPVAPGVPGTPGGKAE